MFYILSFFLTFLLTFLIVKLSLQIQMQMSRWISLLLLYITIDSTNFSLVEWKLMKCI